jgi:hypothetical protein
VAGRLLSAIESEMRATGLPPEAPA